MGPWEDAPDVPITPTQSPVAKVTDKPVHSAAEWQDVDKGLAKEQPLLDQRAADIREKEQHYSQQPIEKLKQQKERLEKIVKNPQAPSMTKQEIKPHLKAINIAILKREAPQWSDVKQQKEVVNNKDVQTIKDQLGKTLSLDKLVETGKQIDEQLKDKTLTPQARLALNTKRQAINELEYDANYDVMDALAAFPLGPIQITKGVEGLKYLVKSGVNWFRALGAVKEKAEEAVRHKIEPAFEFDKEEVESLKDDKIVKPEVKSWANKEKTQDRAIGKEVTLEIHEGSNEDAKAAFARMEKEEGPSSRELMSLQVKDWDARNKVDSRVTMQNIDRLNKLAPTDATKEQLTKDLEDPSKRFLPAVKEARQMLDDVWNEANREGVVKSYVEDYITHIYDFGKQSNSVALKQLYDLADKFMSGAGGGMTTKSQFSRERTFKTLQEAAEKRGLVPKTMDVTKIYNQYATSMLRTRNNKIFIEALKKRVNPATGDEMIKVIPEGKSVPRGYTTIKHPQFNGLMVDESVAPTLKSMMEGNDPGIIMKSAYLTSMAAKAAIFSVSAFHIKTLGDAFLGAIRSPKTITTLPSMYKMWKEGGVGDLVDTALRGGLEIGHSPDMDISVLKGAAEDVGKVLDKALPHLGATVRLPAKGVQLLNDALWKYVHPSLKMAVWNQEYSRQMRSSIMMDKNVAAEKAATFANDIFGGENWRRIAENSNSYLGYIIANEAASKGGQRVLQTFIKAPDWTLATARSWEGAFRKGVPQSERAMYQKYLLQSALIYAGAADVLNVHFTGHHFWQNGQYGGDPTMVDLGDGRKMQLSKHFMEMPRWILDTNQTALNKMGIEPSETIEQLMNKDYLSTKGAPDIAPHKELDIKPGDSKEVIAKKLSKNLYLRLRHILKSTTPITLEQANTQGANNALSGFGGMAVYGKKKQSKTGGEEY